MVVSMVHQWLLLESLRWLRGTALTPSTLSGPTGYYCSYVQRPNLVCNGKISPNQLEIPSGNLT
jgi:hypothetical protein